MDQFFTDLFLHSFLWKMHEYRIDLMTYAENHQVFG